MGILRTDIVSHSQLEGSGSVEFDGVGDTLTFAAHSAFAPATADVTFECFINLSTFTPTSDGSYIFDMGANGYRFQIYNSQLYFGVSGSDYVGPISNAISINTWHHLAGVRDGNSLKLYVDGVHYGTKITTASVTTTSLVIGNHGGEGQAGNYEPVGFISNFRYVRGVVYKGPFTPPKFELKNIPGTIVLGCQSTTSATDFAVTPSTVTANGDAAASAFHPNLKKDITLKLENEKVDDVREILKKRLSALSTRKAIVNVKCYKEEIGVLKDRMGNLFQLLSCAGREGVVQLDGALRHIGYLPSPTMPMVLPSKMAEICIRRAISDVNAIDKIIAIIKLDNHDKMEKQ